MPKSIERIGNEDKIQGRRLRRHTKKWKSLDKDENRSKFAQESMEIVDPMLQSFSNGTMLLSEIDPHAREKVRQALELVHGEIRTTLFQNLRTWMTERDRFEDFCDQHGVSSTDSRLRPASHQYLAIAVILVVEWVAAGLFYGMHLRSPIFGLGWAGAMTAFTFVTAFAVANTARHATQKATKWARFAAASALSLIVGLVGLLAGAHLRDRFEASQESESATTLIQDIAADPLGLTDASWFLLLASVSAFAFVIYHLYGASEHLPGLKERLKALSAGRKQVDSELYRIDQLLDAAVNHTVKRAADKIDRSRVAIRDALALVSLDLTRLGVPNPERISEELLSDPAVKLLAEKRSQITALRDRVFAIGDLFVGLHQPSKSKGSDPAPAPSAPPRVLPHLTQCTRVDEARLWLDRELAGFGLESRSEVDGGNAGE